MSSAQLTVEDIVKVSRKVYREQHSDTLFESEVQKHCLKIRDIKKMKDGDEIDIYFIDRNFCDFVGNYVRERQKKHVRVQDMMDKSYGYFGTFQKTSDIEGKFAWKTLDRLDENFEFDIQLPGLWLPLKEGRVTGDRHTDRPELGKHWSSFDDNTPIGWRGFALKVSDLKKMPVIYRPNFERRIVNGRMNVNGNHHESHENEAVNESMNEN